MLLAMSGAIGAQGNGDATHTLDDLARCHAIAADAARLACYDRASATVVALRSSGALIALDRDAVRKKNTAEFGLGPSRKPPAHARPDDFPAGIDQVSGTVTEVTSSSYGRYLVAMNNGMVWETIDPATPGKGETMVVKRGRLGAFRAFIGGERSVQVQRVR
ncbi:hypothetical protein [Sphingomonas bacterium]|uniref:hypothetical protein n=1 Tax=Sphingomonas bacterium TaxID=1895847 RepID=UPI0015777BC5|nr:hypothetical protein [Sphingomonas bacterium]